MPREQWLALTPERVFNGHYPTTPIHSILDVGSGLSIKSQFINADVRVALDIHRPYLERGRDQAQTQDIIFINADAQDIDRLFLPCSFDLVMLMDVIEHFEMKDAVLLLQKAERIAKKAVIVETPDGFIFQNMDILDMGGERWQTHRSGWSEKLLRHLGYHVERKPYRMSDVQRHTHKRQDPDIMMLFGIKRIG